MARYYVRYSAPNRSYSVIDRERRNDFGDPYVVTPLVTEQQAREIADRLNAELAPIRTYHSDTLGAVTVPE